MNPKSAEQTGNNEKKDEGKLEKIANAIDPAGTEVTDDELIDPGANIKDFPAHQDKTNRAPSKPR